MLNNKNVLFRSKLFCKVYISFFGAGGVKQGAYILEDLIRRFSGKENLSKKKINKLAVMIANDYAVYGFQTDEFFIYDVMSLSDYGKSRFITEGKSRWYFYDKLNKKENTILFDDKSKTYELFKKYYHREILVVNSEAQKDEFLSFVQSNPELIIKPLGSSGGKGVRLFAECDSFSTLLEEYKDGFILEQKLKNDRSFSEFHEASLNTVRIVTVRLNDRVEIPYAFTRMGQNGGCIDNARAGGIMGLIDVETGVIVAASDEHNKHYIFHPNSGKQIVGFRIPQWDEAKAFVAELAQVVPDNRYTGWDVALTDDGWVMIEANCKGQFLAQMPLKEGLKPKFDEYVREIYQ